MDKKGVSAVVATVLIIMIVVAAIGILWVSVVPMIGDDLDFDKETDVRLSIETSGGYTTWDETNNLLSVQVKRGSDDVELSQIKIIVSIDGDSYPKIVEAPDANQAKTYVFKNLNSKPDNVGVSPIFNNGKNGAVLSEIGVFGKGVLGHIKEEDLIDLGGGVGRVVCDMAGDGSECDNLLYCDGEEFCSDSGYCEKGVAVSCDDSSDECKVNVCNEAIDACELQNKEDGTDCSGGVCNGGNCVGSGEYLDLPEPIAGESITITSSNCGGDCTNKILKLKNDVFFNESGYIIDSPNVVIDLGGKTITYGTSLTSAPSHSANGIELTKNSVTIKNGKIEYKGIYQGSNIPYDSIYSGVTDNHLIEGIEIDKGRYGIYIYASSADSADNIVIKDTKIKNIYRSGIYSFYASNLELNTLEVYCNGLSGVAGDKGILVYYISGNLTIVDVEVCNKDRASGDDLHVFCKSQSSYYGGPWVGTAEISGNYCDQISIGSSNCPSTGYEVLEDWETCSNACDDCNSPSTCPA